ncbi:Hyaluronidase [Mucinivorans hirudinis]|uniref:Hyaluronidase n=1 Tax=Mucinivorans hirudinis TaxID=1433126 RepID=A0A060RDN5_9BACT|nr:Hyaluronidase [Mucinivorans hirudinis]
MKPLLLTLTMLLASAATLTAQTIYPTPQKAIISDNKHFLLKGGVQIRGAAQADKDALDLLKTLVEDNKKSTISLTIGERDDKVFAKAAKVDMPDVSGAYYLKVDQTGITIMGVDERGTYYGVQTLRQLIERDIIPFAEILDYPEVAFRGSVEGFYGKPWSHRDRLAQFKFYGENKLNTYIYGPKDDPYHSSLSNHGTSTATDTKGGWRVPYPTAEAEQIRELAMTARKNKVDFVWAIHPGQDIKWNEEDYNHLINKFEDMYRLGVRSFAVFFDDISGEGTNARKQAELLNRINREFVQKKGDVTPLIMCPTEYNKSWANPKPEGYLSILGEQLDPSVQIMWTGDRVCADITMETLNWINERIKRPTYIWWNFPVTDYVRHILLQGPSYGLAVEATKKDMAGFVSNPMENAESSKIALFGVADYTWNPKAYNYLQTWEQAFKAIMPEAAARYRTFAIHSSDLEQNGHGYRRDESWETTLINPLDYSKRDFDALLKDYRELSTSAQTVMDMCKNSYLLEEMKPWLVQAVELGNRGQMLMNFIGVWEHGDNPAIWEGYLSQRMTSEQTAAYNKHKVGTLKLQPFINQTRATIAEKFYEKLSGKPLKKVIPMTSFARQETLPAMIDGNSQSYFYSWGAQKAGDWVGVDLGEPTVVNNIYVEQGRKQGDRDYFQEAILEYSNDAINWTTLKEIGDSTYTIKYNEKPIEARYVRLRADAGVSTKNWTAFRRFDVNPMQREAIMLTNIAQVAATRVVTEGKNIAIQPILEVIRVEPEGYFGIELPLTGGIEKVDVDLNINRPVIEYSVDGAVWSDKALSQARYIRYINKGAKPVEVNLRRFVVTTTADNEGALMNLFDKNLESTYPLNGKLAVVVPAGARSVVILAAGDAKAAVNGKANIIDGAYSQMALGDDKEIVIEGAGTLHEIVFE